MLNLHKEAQGELLGTATQIVIGGRLMVKEGVVTENSAPDPMEQINGQSLYWRRRLACARVEIKQ